MDVPKIKFCWQKGFPKAWEFRRVAENTPLKTLNKGGRFENKYADTCLQIENIIDSTIEWNKLVRLEKKIH